tara:strand:- start:99 stop:254 length:156 start_codon:yes stop_codon:yes gene_type:complete
MERRFPSQIRSKYYRRLSCLLLTAWFDDWTESRAEVERIKAEIEALKEQDK